MSNLDLFTRKSKEEIAIERLRTFCPPEGYYVAFSGGKDSIVILDLVKRSGCKFDAHYNLTTVDPPELVQFIKKEHHKVEIHHPEKNMWKLIAEQGLSLAPRGTVYILVGFNTTEQEDLYRVQKVIDLGHDPYIMPYHQNKQEKRFKRFIDSFMWRKHKTIEQAWGNYTA